jgi:hypothetical protein
MSRTLNIKKVETALKEAAVRATYGTREERSGRFLPVQSSVMTAVEYNEEESALEITFTSGKTYRYRDVPLDIYIGLTDAESKGAFFNEQIKGAFEFVEVSRRRR